MESRLIGLAYWGEQDWEDDLVGKVRLDWDAELYDCHDIHGFILEHF